EFPEMTLRAALTVPPTRFFEAPPAISTPTPLPTAWLPVASRPMVLPWTLLFIVPASVRYTPVRLPEMRLPAPGRVPPTVLLVAPAWIVTPEPRLPTTVPALFRPMVLPCTRLPDVPMSDRSTPAFVLPEMTLPAPGAMPPTVLFVASFPIDT